MPSIPFIALVDSLLTLLGHELETRQPTHYHNPLTNTLHLKIPSHPSKVLAYKDRLAAVVIGELMNLKLQAGEIIAGEHKNRFYIDIHNITFV